MQSTMLYSKNDSKAKQMHGFDERSKTLRRKIIETLAISKRGHLPSALSIVEILRALYDHILEIDPKKPKQEKRDRFILSKGHGCLALYVMLADKGFFPEEELKRFCADDGILGGHPLYGSIPGVEASTGALGHGPSIGIGMALNAKMINRSHRIFVLVGDGECNEGSVWEAALSAGKHCLSNFTIIIDYNKQQSYGTTSEILELEPFSDKWRSFNFSVEEVDGHDMSSLLSCFKRIPFQNGKPNAIICHTTKGKGIDGIERNLAWHHKSNIGDDDIRDLFNGLE